MIETPGTIPCAACGSLLDLARLRPGGRVSCGRCLNPIEIDFFPADSVPLMTGHGEALEEGTDSACFFHAGKKAAAACGACGRYLCGLCVIDFAGETRCASCLESGKKKGKLSELDDRRTLYDSMVLVIPLASIIMWPVMFFTAPLTLFLTVWYWKKPGSLFRANRWRFVLAAVIALVELLGIAWFLFAMVKGFRQ